MRITPQISTILAGIFLVLCGALSSAAANTGDGATTTPKVVVTILPLHSLVSGVMAGATGGTSEPVLLLPATASPHTAALRPSQAQALAKADVIFWMGEDLETLGKSGATLAIHLSVNNLVKVVRELTPHYGADCPVAVCYRVGWPDQEIIEGRLDDIRDKVKAAGFTRTALIMVGRVLDPAAFDDSRLYAADHHHVLRPRKTS